MRRRRVGRLVGTAAALTVAPPLLRRLERAPTARSTDVERGAGGGGVARWAGGRVGGSEDAEDREGLSRRANGDKAVRHRFGASRALGLGARAKSDLTNGALHLRNRTDPRPSFEVVERDEPRERPDDEDRLGRLDRSHPESVLAERESGDGVRRGSDLRVERRRPLVPRDASFGSVENELARRVDPRDERPARAFRVSRGSDDHALELYVVVEGGRGEDDGGEAGGAVPEDDVAVLVDREEPDLRRTSEGSWGSWSAARREGGGGEEVGCEAEVGVRWRRRGRGEVDEELPFEGPNEDPPRPRCRRTELGVAVEGEEGERRRFGGDGDLEVRWLKVGRSSLPPENYVVVQSCPRSDDVLPTRQELNIRRVPPSKRHQLDSRSPLGSSLLHLRLDRLQTLDADQVGVLEEVEEEEVEDDDEGPDWSYEDAYADPNGRLDDLVVRRRLGGDESVVVELYDRNGLDVDVHRTGVGRVDRLPKRFSGALPHVLVPDVISSLSSLEGRGEVRVETRAEEGTIFGESCFGAKGGEVVVGAVHRVEEEVDEDEEGKGRRAGGALANDGFGAGEEGGNGAGLDDGSEFVKVAAVGGGRGRRAKGNRALLKEVGELQKKLGTLNTDVKPKKRTSNRCKSMASTVAKNVISMQ